MNLIGSLNGRIGDDKDAMLAQADQVLNLPKMEQRVYQNMRRHGLIDNYEQMKAQMLPQQAERMKRDAESFETDEMWEDYLNDILRRYV